MSDQLQRMAATVAMHKEKAKGEAMPILIVELNRRHGDGTRETLWGVEVQGEVRVTYPTREEAEAFALDIVRGGA